MACSRFKSKGLGLRGLAESSPTSGGCVVGLWFGGTRASPFFGIQTKKYLKFANYIRTTCMRILISHETVEKRLQPFPAFIDLHMSL